MGKHKVIGFEATEEIAFSLPSVFKCRACGRLYHCMRPPDPLVCLGCNDNPLQLKRLEIDVDPDENLKQQLALASHIVWAAEEGRKVTTDDAHQLAELVINLHDWIRKGGFLPACWRKETT